MGKYVYVYVIDSQSHPGRYYIGFTEDLDARLKHHNAGAVPSTKAYRPWGYRYLSGIYQSRARTRF